MSINDHQTAKAIVDSDGCGIKGKACIGGTSVVSRGVTKDCKWVERSNARPKVVRRVKSKCPYEYS